MTLHPADTIARNGGLKFRRYKPGRAGEILTAATAEFVEKGFAGARLDDVAARLGLKRTSVYRYFTDKEDVFRAVVIHTLAPQVEALRALSVNHATSLPDLLRGVVRPMARIAVETPLGAVMKLVIGEGGNFPELAKIWHDQLLGPTLEVLAKAIGDAQVRGEVRAGDPYDYAFQALSPLLAALMLRETFAAVGVAPNRAVEPLLHQCVETFLAGVMLAPLAEEQP